ncbi:hypothetical protein [Azospirillum halopraeferens]|uniref:hypothetical protein n=1 Tax=Azospirillum halopraeferens TaxID=34010 RepID=UPI000419DEB4|nr:hypothetical protein [Azospirillum halopraeferens]
MKTATGIITLVQEGRFRLATDDGPPLLLVLSKSADAEPQDLPALQRAQARVTVRYEDAGTVIAGIVHHLAPMESRR